MSVAKIGVLTDDQRASLAQVSTATSSAPTSLPESYLSLAWELCRIHGRVQWAKEAHGIHLYMASPICLTQDGQIELRKMHLAVNIEKHFKMRRDKVGMCMKTGQHYKVSELLRMPPLEDRGISNAVRSVKQDTTNEEFLEDDGRGNKVPKGPGDVVPIIELPDDHPASVYLASRQFDRSSLYEQFQLCYGIKENPYMARFYRRMIKGFKATPQGRLIFNIDVLGVRRGWQTRILELEGYGPDDQKYLYFFHPYNQTWTPVKRWNPEGNGRWTLLPGYEDWDPVKYAICNGAKRNSLIMGFDAAVASEIKDKQGHKFCYLVEGALDAGRLGVPAVANLGKFLSVDQADLLASRFERVIYVQDNDAAGDQAKQSVASAFAEHSSLVVDFVKPPEQFKDVGEMSPQEASDFKAVIT